MRAIDYFDKSADLHPDRIAIIDGDRRYSYREARVLQRTDCARLVGQWLEA